MSGHKTFVTFKKKFVEPTAESDTLATVGLEDEYEPIIMAGVAAQLISGKDIPAVRTKDFDATAPSRGFEATLFPVAVKIFRYEGCAGCALTYQYPTKLVAEHGKNTFNLPLLTRGGYYLPSTLRKSILKDPSKELQFRAKTTEGEFIMEISEKSISEYTKMLKLLEYDFEL